MTNEMSRDRRPSTLSRMLRVKWGAPVLAAVAIAACKESDAVTAASGGPVAVVSLDPQRRPALGDVVVSQPDPPPPISGGTLAVSRTTRLAVAADPDRDRIYVVDLSLRALRHTVQLAPHTEPGRVALDESGHAFVALRRSGELATVDLATGNVIVQAACVAPRGVAWDPWRNRVVVACASGNLMALQPLGGTPSTVGARLDLDLRDVIVREKRIDVTTFRRANLHSLGVDGASDGRSESGIAGGNVAWRMRPLGADEELAQPMNVIIEQDATSSAVSTQAGGYGDGTGNVCRPGIVGTRLVLAREHCTADSCADSIRLPDAVLPVDVATNGHDIVVVAAGNAFTRALPQIFVVGRDDLLGRRRQDCAGNIRLGNVTQGQAVAADFSSLDELVVQTREPAQLHIMTDDRLRTFKTIDLASDARADTGHAIFHANAGGQIACASCHAEGGDDGHIWTFDGIGPRRTPSLLGTTAHTEPFHWDGDMQNLATLVEHVFVERMSGPELDASRIEALGKYLFALPAPPRLRSAVDVSPRGKDLFEKKCGVCHSGAMMTNNQSLDVGTGGKFQVPSLVGVAWHGPWIHNGCANTLFDRFNPDCGGSAHAEMKGLTDTDTSLIVETMESF